MARLLAFVDGSVYSRSVCDHAAWAAARMAAPVEVLHVLGRRQVSSVPADLSGSLAVDDREALLAELSGFDEQRAKLAHRRGWPPPGRPR
jgi:nucleotide-binding universal stress UspA family protein